MARIVVGEDDIAYRSILIRELEAEGHEVREAGDGYDACQIAESEPVDLILLGESLSVFDGFEACRRLRAYPDLAETPIVLLASNKPDPRRVEAAGFSEVLLKGESGAQLREMLVRLLGPLANPRE